jgi:protein SCO1/2
MRPGRKATRASRLCRLLAPLSGLVLLAAASGAAAAGPIDSGEALRLSQAAIGRTIGEHRFTDQAGQALQLSGLRGRPVVISYIYTSCAFICPTLTASLAAVVKVARETLGDDSFAVVTVGFDTPVDTPEQMRRYAAERGIADARWYFVSADQATVDRLAQEIGFAYAPTAGGFDHLTQVTILDGAGRVYQQVYGPEFQPPMIVDPLKKLALGMAITERPLADFLSRVRLICTSYDPKSGRYRFDYSLILEIAIGLSCAVAVFGFVLRAWRHSPASPAPRP